MADCLFARYQLEKHGWTEGAGLGKREDGITNPIKVSRKNNKDGIGHVPGSDLTTNWWDQAYNKVASQILVKTTTDGVTVHATETKESNKNKSLLYARFVKGATLKTSEGITIEEPEDSSESDREKEQIPPRLTDEEIFKICGGRTAHKAAGHGLKQNGKLQRIWEQERQYMESLNKKADYFSNVPIAEPKRGKKHKRVVEEQKEHILLNEEMNSLEELHKKKRKKETHEEARQVEDTTELVEYTKKEKKKKRKEKKQHKRQKEDKEEQSGENGKFTSTKKKQKRKCEMQEEKLGAGLDIEEISASEIKVLQEFGELTEKKKKYRMKKEQLKVVESMEKKKMKTPHLVNEEIECTEENQKTNKTLNQSELEAKERKKKYKKKKKKEKKQEREKNLIKNEESSVKIQQQNIEEVLGDKIEEDVNENACEQKSVKIDNCQKKVRFSLELVTVFTFSDEENETSPPQTPKKKKKRKKKDQAFD